MTTCRTMSVGHTMTLHKRPYLCTAHVSVKQGNRDMYIKSRHENGYRQNHDFYGITPDPVRQPRHSGG